MSSRRKRRLIVSLALAAAARSERAEPVIAVAAKA